MSANVGDGFFVSLLNKKSDNLLAFYIDFLKYRGAARGDNRVTQLISSKNLAGEIGHMLNLLLIFRHLGLIDLSISLLIERDLLLVKLELLRESQLSRLSKRSGEPSKIKKQATNNRVEFQKSILGELHQQISEFVLGQGRVQNTEIFSKFPSNTKRTLKRKLRELINAGFIKRLAEGKKVFYVGASHSLTSNTPLT